MTFVPTSITHPFTMMVAGPTMSGKTYFVREFLSKNGCITPAPQRILWVYGEWQPEYDKLKTRFGSIIEFICGWSQDIYRRLQPQERNVLVLDDVMSSCSSDQSMSDLFTKGSSHRNTTVIFIVQNLYFQGKAAIDIRRNCQIFVAYRSPSDKSVIKRLARQAFPENPKFLTAAFDDATTEKHGYLLIDFRPACPEQFCLRSNILDEAALTIYMLPKTAENMTDII